MIILAVAVPPAVVVILGVARHHQLVQVIVVQVAVAFIAYRERKKLEKMARKFQLEKMAGKFKLEKIAGQFKLEKMAENSNVKKWRENSNLKKWREKSNLKEFKLEK